MQSLFQFVVAGITVGSIYGLVGVGFSMIFNATGAINFAQGEFVVLGAFISISLTLLGIPVFLSIIISSLIMFLAGLLIERLIVRRVSTEMLSLIIATVGVSLILRTIALIFWGREPLAFRHFFTEKPILISGVAITPQAVFIIFLSIVILIVLEYFFGKTIHGKAMRSVVEDREAARVLGISAEKYTGIAFGLSGALAAIAGSSVAPIALLSYHSGVLLGLKGFAACVIGGLNKPKAAVLGGVIIGVIESLGAAFFPSGFKDAIALIILLLVLAFKPEGLLGTRRLRKV